MLLAFIMIPLLQRELDTFKDTIWNAHRIRPQKDAVLPCGIPDHIYSFPEEYGLEPCGLPVSEDQLREAAEESGVLNAKDDFLDPAVRMECERLIPNFNNIAAKDCREAYLYLKHNFNIHLSTQSFSYLQTTQFGHCNQQVVTGIRHDDFHLKQSVTYFVVIDHTTATFDICHKSVTNK